jgi:hypothetical protein
MAASWWRRAVSALALLSCLGPKAEGFLSPPPSGKVRLPDFVQIWPPSSLRELQ